MRYKKVFVFIVLIGVLCGILGGGLLLLSRRDGQHNDAVRIIVAVCADNPPFTFVDTQGAGVPVGFEIDLMEEIGKRIGKGLKIQDMDFANIIASLQSGRADAAVAAMENTPERAANLDFSDPYYQAERSLVTKEETGEKISWEGKVVGAQLGSSHEKFLKMLAHQHPSLRVISYNRVGEMVQDMKNGRLYGILMDLPVAKRLTQKEGGQRGGFYQKVLPFSGSASAIAFPKGSALVEEVNKALREIQEEGTLDKIKEKWRLGN